MHQSICSTYRTERRGLFQKICDEIVKLGSARVLIGTWHCEWLNRWRWVRQDLVFRSRSSLYRVHSIIMCLIARTGRTRLSKYHSRALSMCDNTSANYRYHFAVFNTKPLVYHISPHIAQGYCVYDRLIGGEAVIIVAGLDSFPPNRRFLLVNRREKIGQLTKNSAKWFSS